MSLYYKAAAVLMQEKEIKSGVKGRRMPVTSFVKYMHVLTDAVSWVVITYQAEIIAR